MKFENRVAVITGGAGTIGRAVCRMFCEHGVSVALTDISLESAEKAAAEIRQDGGVIKAYEMNVESMESVQAASQKILEDFSHVDILINNAGLWKAMPFAEMTEEHWLKHIDLNLNGTFRVTRAFVNAMREHGYGRIINLASIAGEVGLPRLNAYSASKAGVIILTKTMAMELAKENITVNCVSPGMVSPTGETRETNKTWVGRTCKATEIARVIVFLASDESGFITGVDHTVDGGRILGPLNQ